MGGGIEVGIRERERERYESSCGLETYHGPEKGLHLAVPERRGVCLQEEIYVRFI